MPGEIRVDVIKSNSGLGTVTLNNSGQVLSGITTVSSGPVIIGTTSATGTSSQPLQVSGGAYVSGNLGVGVTNPTARLEIASSATSGYGYIQLGRSATASQNWHFGSEGNNYLNFWNGNFGAGIGPLLSLYSPGNTTNHAVLISGSGVAPSLTGTASQPLQVTGGAYVSGNLGIGTTNPPDNLTVLGKIQIQQDSGFNNRLILSGISTSNSRWNIDNFGTTNLFRIFREDQQTGANGVLAVGIDTSSNYNFQFNSGYGSAATAYGCRAWVNFNGTGTVAINGSGNVSSITDNGTGDYTVNFTTAMPDTNYCVSGTSSSVTDITDVRSTQQGSSTVTGLFPRGTTTRLVGSVRVFTAFFDHSIDCAVAVDCQSVSVAIFR